MSCSSLCLVYGSYEHVPISYDRFLTALGYYRKGWCFNRIYCHVHHCAWYMGHTNMCQFHTTVFWQLLVTIEKDDVSIESIVMFIIVLGIWVIWACANFIWLFFDSLWLQYKMMMFQLNLFSCLKLNFCILVVVDCVVWYWIELHWICISQQFFSSIALQAMNFLYFFTQW